MDREQARQEIRQQISCLKYLTKSKKGLYCCPYCGSGTGVNQSGALKLYNTNTFYCHACKKGGDVIDLHQNETGTDYNTALEELAQELGITIDKYRPLNAIERAQRDFNDAGSINPLHAAKSPQSATEAQTEATPNYTEYYRKCREQLDNPAALAYLKLRGISVETARHYWIGFDAAADPANNPGGTGRSLHPCPRLIIPTNAAHYVGRRTDGQKGYEKMNPGGSTPAIFNERALYAQDVQEIFVVEGAIDALSVIEAGGVAIGLNSTGNVDVLLEALEQKKTAATLLLCLDNDGKPNTAKALQKLRDGLQRLNVAFMDADICGQHKDPNDALVADRQGFIEAVAKAKAAENSGENAVERFLLSISGDKYRPIPTGIKDLDRRIGGGFIRQWLILIGAEPGAGKTALATQIFENIARTGRQCVYINLEMSEEQLLARAITRTAYQTESAELDALTILRGYAHTPEIALTVQRAAAVYKHDVAPYLQYNPDNISSNLDDILAAIEVRAERAKAQGKPAPIVCLDYLQLITGREREDNTEVLKRAVVGLKGYARRHNTAVVCIIAQSRKANESKEASMTAGRDTSNLEYTADLQMQLIKDKDRANIVKLYVTKSRFTAPSLDKSTDLFFRGAQGIFEDVSDFDDYYEATGIPRKAGKKL